MKNSILAFAAIALVLVAGCGDSGGDSFESGHYYGSSILEGKVAELRLDFDWDGDTNGQLRNFQYKASADAECSESDAVIGGSGSLVVEEPGTIVEVEDGKVAYSDQGVDIEFEFGDFGDLEGEGSWSFGKCGEELGISFDPNYIPE